MFFCCGILRADHNSGINISYTCLDGSTYEITVNRFRNCADPEPAAADLNVYIYSSCETPGFVSFPLTEVSEVSQLCPSALPQSTCAGGFEPGTELNVYRAEVTLNPCADWRIVVAEQNRTNVLNLISPETSRIHVEAFLNNEDGTCNTSPSMGVLNLPYVCVASPIFYNLGFSEPDGDSLVYALTPALTSLVATAPEEMEYPPPYSGEEPLPGMTLNPGNGQITATPANPGMFNTAVSVSEYRDGVLVGRVTHDFTFIVNPCPAPVPAPVAGSLSRVSGGGYPTGPAEVGVCEGDDFCFEIAFASAEPSYSVDLISTVEALIPDAEMTVAGTNPATATFCGTVPADFSGGSFLITASDDACPVIGQSFYAVDLVLRKPVVAEADTLVCAGEPVNLFAENGDTHTWTLEGEEVMPGPDFSCNPCDNPTAATDSTVVFTATGAYPESTCQNFDEVTVFISLTSSVEITPESCDGNDGGIDIQVIYGSGDYTAVWADIGPGPFSRTGLASGTYEVVLNDLELGCTGLFAIEVPQAQFPTADAGPDASTCGLTFAAEAVPSFGAGTWTLPDGLTAANPNDPQTAITAAAYGTYTLTWTEDAGAGCTDFDTAEITFIEPPTVSAALTDTACGSALTLPFTAQGDEIFWSVTAGLEVIQGTDSAEFTAAAEGAYIAVLTAVTEDICTATAETELVFFDIPELTLSAPQAVCDTLASVDGEATSGSFTWNLPSGVTAVTEGPGNLIEFVPESPGTYAFIAVSENGPCTVSDTTLVTFPGTPLISDPVFACTGFDALFTLTFTVTQGLPGTYGVQGLDGTFEGATFTSVALPSETPVEAILTDAADCGADTLSGTLFCPIITDAGSMSPDTLRPCDDGVSAAPASGVALDGNDTLLYALHTLPGPALGEVQAWSEFPEFSFGPDMVYETVYYISSVAGNATPDGVNLSDPFLSVAEGTPVVFYQSPEAVLSGELIACPYDTVAFTVEISGALPVTLTYSINGVSAAVTAEGPEYEIQTAEEGTYTLTSAASDWCTGSVSGSAVLTHYDLPAAQMSTDTFICEGDTGTLNIAFEGAAPFSYEVLLDSVSVGAFTANQDTATLPVEIGGTYSIANLSDAQCAAEGGPEVFLDVRPLPEAALGPDTVLCHGAVTPFGNPPEPGAFYTWDSVPGLGAFSGSPVNFTPSHDAPEPVTVTLGLTAVLNGCTQRDSARVTVYEIPEAEIFGYAPFCAGDTVALFGAGADSLSWLPEEAFTSPTEAVTRYTAEVTGPLALVVTNAGGCRDTAIVLGEVLPLPDAAFTAKNAEGCAPLETRFEQAAHAEDVSYTWHTDGRSFMRTAPDFTYTYTSAGTYPVSLEAVSSAGCTRVFDFPDTVRVYTTFADFRFSPQTPNSAQPRTEFTNLSPQDTESTWIVDSLIEGRSRHFVYTFPEEGAVYSVCLETRSAEGCLDRICRRVTVEDSFFLFMPNAFTPDGDGLNDLFGPVLSHYNPAEYEFWVADRRGNIVFRTTDPRRKWNGGGASGSHYEGTGVYVWQIEVRPDFDLEVQTYRGTVTLLR